MTGNTIAFSQNHLFIKRNERSNKKKKDKLILKLDAIRYRRRLKSHLIDQLKSQSRNWKEIDLVWRNIAVTVPQWRMWLAVRRMAVAEVSSEDKELGKGWWWWKVKLLESIEGDREPTPRARARGVHFSSHPLFTTNLISAPWTDCGPSKLQNRSIKHTNRTGSVKMSYWISLAKNQTSA